MNHEHEVVRGGGPENTHYDRVRHEKMSLRPMRYGFFRVAKEATLPDVCEKCHKEIYGQKLNVNGKLYHYNGCYTK